MRMKINLHLLEENTISLSKKPIFFFNTCIFIKIAKEHIKCN